MEEAIVYTESLRHSVFAVPFAKTFYNKINENIIVDWSDGERNGGFKERAVVILKDAQHIISDTAHEDIRGIGLIQDSASPGGGQTSGRHPPIAVSCYRYVLIL
ncbi:MAG: hypothetical protein IJU61_11040 [Victivallales bacterium]|nr:hypothetical protein [Victivallales bacterium]